MSRRTIAALFLFVLSHSTVALAADTQPAPLVTVSRGDVPIILSSPHGGRQPIPGAPARTGGAVAKGFVTVVDTNTAELTERLADAIAKEFGGRPYMVIARFERRFADANRPPADAYEHPAAKPHYDAYHAALAAACADVKARWGRGLLLDVHGQAVAADSIFRGTRNGTSVTELIKRDGTAALIGPTSVLGALKAAGYEILPATDEKAADVKARIGKEEKFNGGYITDAYGSHRGTGIDAIQMEFGGTFRRKDRLDKTAADVAKAIKTFSVAHLPKAGAAATQPVGRNQQK